MSDGSRVPPRELLPGLRHRLVGVIGSMVLRMLGATWTISWIGDERGWLSPGSGTGPRCIWAFWHGMILPLAYSHRGRGVVVLVSKHGDGEIISQIICAMGYGVVRGSSTRGGLRALLQMARAGEAGFPLSVTPDGPRGPREVLQPGILHIAHRSGLPIVPLAAAALRATRLRSWDGFLVPHPFSRVAIATGTPIAIPSETPAERLEPEWGPVVASGLRSVNELADRWRSTRTGP